LYQHTPLFSIRQAEIAKDKDDWARNHKDRVRKNARYAAWKRRTGFERPKLESTFGKCAICKKDRKLFLDHNHLTRETRGFLCQGCNWRLGWFEAREKEIFEYLGR